MKKYFVALTLSVLSVGALADWLSGIGAAAGRAAEMMDKSENEAIQQRQDERRHELEMKRIEREYELRAQEQARARQQPLDQDDPRNRTKESIRSQLDSVHPGWQATLQSEDFAKWRGQQPESIKRLLVERKISSLILALDIYKRDQK